MISNKLIVCKGNDVCINVCNDVVKIMVKNEYTPHNIETRRNFYIVPFLKDEEEVYIVVYDYDGSVDNIDLIADMISKKEMIDIRFNNLFIINNNERLTNFSRFINRNTRHKTFKEYSYEAILEILS